MGISITDKKYLLRNGYKEDVKNKMLYNIFYENEKFKLIDISIDSFNSFMALARTTQKNVTAYINTIQDDRLIIKKNKNIVMNIILNEIQDCFVKIHSDFIYEFKFEVCNICCSLYIIL